MCGAIASTTSSEPQMISDRASVTPAPQRSVMMPPIAASAGGRDDARREEEAELRVGEVERALDVDRGDRERARVEPEEDEPGGDGSEGGAHAASLADGARRRPSFGSVHRVDVRAGDLDDAARSARPSGAGHRSGAAAPATADSRASCGSPRCDPRAGPSARGGRSDSGPRCSAGAGDDRTRAWPR